jgi:hypothetical protein
VCGLLNTKRAGWGEASSCWTETRTKKTGPATVPTYRPAPAKFCSFFSLNHATQKQMKGPIEIHTRPIRPARQPSDQPTLASTPNFTIFCVDSKFHTRIFSELKRRLSLRARFAHVRIIHPKSKVGMQNIYRTWIYPLS